MIDAFGGGLIMIEQLFHRLQQACPLDATC